MTYIFGTVAGMSTMFSRASRRLRTRFGLVPLGADVVSGFVLSALPLAHSESTGSSFTGISGPKASASETAKSSTTLTSLDYRRLQNLKI